MIFTMFEYVIFFFTMNMTDPLYLWWEITMIHRMTKPTKLHMHPAKTQSSLSAVLHLSMFSPGVGGRGLGGGGDTLGLDSQNSPCPQELGRRLWHHDGT